MNSSLHVVILSFTVLCRNDLCTYVNFCTIAHVSVPRFNDLNDVIIDTYLFGFVIVGIKAG